MYRLDCAESGAQEIGFIYTSLLAVLLLSAVTMAVAEVLKGNHTFTAQEEVEQVGVRLQQLVEELLAMVRAYPGIDATLSIPAATEEHGVLYTVIGTETGLKVVSKAPVGGRYTADFPLAPATAIEGKVYSSTSYIVVQYDATSQVVTLTAG